MNEQHRPEPPQQDPGPDAGPTGTPPPVPEPADEAFARLRAADPAARATADREALRRVIDTRAMEADAIAEPSPATVTAPAPEPDPAGETGLAPVLPLRRRPAAWLRIAAAVAGVAVIGAGGFALGRETDTVAAAPAITLDQSAGTEMSSAADLRIGGWFGRNFFTAAGLDGTGSSAHGWALDAAAVFSAETVVQAAALLGVDGSPELTDGMWTVGSTDGTGPVVQLQPDGTASLSFYDPTRDPWACADSATETPDATTDPSLDLDLIEPESTEPGLPSCDPVAPAPTGDAAVTAARDLLTGLGLDPADFEFTVEDTGDDTRSTMVTAVRVVDGQQTTLTWSVILMADGVQNLSGSLAPVIDLGEYPVISPASAVDRLNDPRFGATSTGIVPLSREDASATASDPAASDTATQDPATVPDTPVPGSAVSWPVERVTITDARLGLTQVWQEDGSVVLAPAYQLTGQDGSEWSVLAVEDTAIDFG